MGYASVLNQGHEPCLETTGDLVVTAGESGVYWVAGTQQWATSELCLSHSSELLCTG